MTPPPGAGVAPAVPLASARVVLTPTGPADRDDIVALHRDPRVTVHLLDGIPDDARKAGIYLEWAAGLHACGIGPWSARRRGTGRFLGLFTLTPVDHDPLALEFGGRLSRAGWPGDLAVEAGAAVIDHAFAGPGATRLVSVHHPDNRTAPVALARLGFGASRPVTMFGRNGVEVSLDVDRWAALGRRALPPVVRATL